MNVAELIEKLKELPQELPVYTCDYYYGYEEPDPYVTMRLKPFRDGKNTETIVRL